MRIEVEGSRLVLDIGVLVLRTLVWACSDGFGACFFMQKSIDFFAWKVNLFQTSLDGSVPLKGGRPDLVGVCRVRRDVARIRRQPPELALQGSPWGTAISRSDLNSPYPTESAYPA